MKEYRRSMAAAVRRAILATFGVGLFWLVWNAITGSVPTIRAISDPKFMFFLPFPYSRWWDILATFIAIPTLWSLIFGFIKLAPHLGIREQYPKPNTFLKIWLGVSSFFAVLTNSLAVEWLGYAFAFSAGFGIIAGLAFGWGSGVAFSLGFWLGECLYFGLKFGLGIGLLAFLIGILALSFLGNLIASLVIGLHPGLISKPLPRLRDWLAAKDIEE